MSKNKKSTDDVKTRHSHDLRSIFKYKTIFDTYLLTSWWCLPPPLAVASVRCVDFVAAKTMHTNVRPAHPTMLP
jgi:hypothetical protein